MTARPGLVFSPEAPTDARIETTWNNMSNPGAFAVAGAEEREGGEPPPLAGAGVVVCLRAWGECSGRAASPPVRRRPAHQRAVARSPGPSRAIALAALSQAPPSPHTVFVISSLSPSRRRCAPAGSIRRLAADPCRGRHAAAAPLHRRQTITHGLARGGTSNGRAYTVQSRRALPRPPAGRRHSAINCNAISLLRRSAYQRRV